MALLTLNLLLVDDITANILYIFKKKEKKKKTTFFNQISKLKKKLKKGLSSKLFYEAYYKPSEYRCFDQYRTIKTYVLYIHPDLLLF